MEDKKTVQVNNLQIKWNRTFELWQVYTPIIKSVSYTFPRGEKYRICLEEFKTKYGAIGFAEDTTDYIAKGKFEKKRRK